MRFSFVVAVHRSLQLLIWEYMFDRFQLTPLTVWPLPFEAADYAIIPMSSTSSLISAQRIIYCTNQRLPKTTRYYLVVLIHLLPNVIVILFCSYCTTCCIILYYWFVFKLYCYLIFSHVYFVNETNFFIIKYYYLVILLHYYLLSY